MAALYLIRHGQASFGEPEYDCLSQKGHQQGVMLGKSWQTMVQPDAIYAGSLKRHIQTLAAFAETNPVHCDTSTLTELNEFDHVDILMNSDLGAHQASNFPALVEHFATLPDAKAQFNQAFNHCLEQWVSGQSDNYQESWQQFKQRTTGALTTIIESRKAEQQTLMAFTSGGVIAAIVQSLLGISDQQCLTLMQQIRNTSVTKILFSGDRVTLDYLNNYRHLEQVGNSWSTYR